MIDKTNYFSYCIRFVAIMQVVHKQRRCQGNILLESIVICVFFSLLKKVLLKLECENAAMVHFILLCKITDIHRTL